MITNLKTLIKKSSLRKKILAIAEAGYRAIEIPKVISEKMKIEEGRFLKIKYTTTDSVKPITKSETALRLDLNNFRRIFIIGIGKGSALALLTLAEILDKRLTGGAALDVQRPKLKIKNLKLKILTGTHPLPSKQNIAAAQKIIKLAKNLKKDDLLIAFICGGGSALLCGSEKELRYSQTIFKELTKAGADIKELNIVRKHLSNIKGGGLAKLAYPATVVSLIVSDVPTANNDLSIVASGPTVYDKTTKKDAEKILNKYFNLKRANVHSVKDSNLKTLFISKIKFYETPKNKEYFKKVKNILFLSNYEPILAMSKKAKEFGLKPKIYSLKLKGEAKRILLPMIKKVNQNEVMIAGGEAVVRLENQELKTKDKNYKLQFVGKGGRNQEAVLGALSFLDKKLKSGDKNLTIISIASDGWDNTEAAGAIGDVLTLKKSKKLHPKLNSEEYLNSHNSFNFFKKTGDLIYVEKKCFNVADLMLVLKELKE